MSIELMMLQVLDDPTGVRIIVETNYPDFSNQNETQNAYFMIDRGECPNIIWDEKTDSAMKDEKGATVYDDGKVFDYWQVTDSLGQIHKFNSNVELIEFVGSIESITVNAWVESF